jgi:acetyl-CoA carboxylase beta subunit
MSIFQKCPICGEFAFIVPELGTEKEKVFRCDNGHEFTKKQNVEVKVDKEITEKLPYWAKTLETLPKKNI